MNVIETKLDGVKILEPRVFPDSRGFFFEGYSQERYHDITEGLGFVQDNYSRSTRGTLRGLHFQTRRPQGKLVGVITGAVYDVAADINPDSPTFGEYVGVELSDTNHRQLYVPPGYAHGFCVISPVADFYYKCTDVYDPGFEGGIIWNDPTLSIEWPMQEPLLSEKDAVLPSLKEHAGL